MRSMVEGYAVSSAAYDLLYPSTTLRVVPLPLGGGSLQSATGRFRSFKIGARPLRATKSLSYIVPSA